MLNQSSHGPASAPLIYLIDGSAYVYRAYHAVRGLSNSKGLPTNAIFGFTRMLIKLMQERAPAYMAIFFDAKGPTFRHRRYADYKANRPPMPDDLVVQLPYIRKVTEGFNIPQLELEGYEADDLIGTYARLSQQAGFAVVMVTGDKDFQQLVTESASIWDPMKDRTIDLDTIRQDFGLEPRQLIDVMGLSGDTADNVPGVPGIGPKTAQNLIRTYGNMDALYKQVERIKAKKQRQNLIAFEEQARLSRELVTIDIQAPVKFAAEALRTRPADTDSLATLFRELEFRQLQQDFGQTSDASQKRYGGILTSDALEALAQRLEAAERFALDTETTSVDPMQARLIGLSFAMEPDEAFYIPCGHRYLGAPEQLKIDQVLGRLKALLEDPGIAKVGQNIKYDWIVLLRHGIDLAGVRFDTMLASYLLNPAKRAHNLDQIALDYLNHQTITYEQVAGKGKKSVGFDQVTVEKAIPYASEDADVTLRASRVLAEAMKADGLTRLFEEVEMPLVPVLLRMEMAGICVDTEKLQQLSKDFEQQLGQLEEQIWSLAGERFNVKSSQQLGVILFEKLGLPAAKRTLKKTAYSTDVDVLTKLAERHELPAVVLRHRTLAKLKSTYADALLTLINPETGRLHTSFNQTVAATGRLSSSDPNLQNIPIRTEEGRQIRRAFVPRPGWRLVSADYSQIELRILAHVSRDEILIDAFQRGEDIHSRTAAEVFEVSPETVTEELRRQAKAINFGIIYGMSAYGLSKQLAISQKMAQTFIDHYFSRYQGVKRYIDETIATARESRHTSTLLGRVRPLPDIDSGNRNLRLFAERTAINTPIQGTAADLIKIAMIRMDEALRKKGLQSVMLLSVHDEIVFETPPEEATQLFNLARAVMEGVWELKAPLKVNIAEGQNWAEAH